MAAGAFFHENQKYELHFLVYPEPNSQIFSPRLAHEQPHQLQLRLQKLSHLARSLSLSAPKAQDLLYADDDGKLWV